MIEKDDPLGLRIEALRVLARTDQPNRALLIERNIEDYLKTAGSEKPSLERLREKNRLLRIGYAKSTR
jgi:hypothetical protein